MADLDRRAAAGCDHVTRRGERCGAGAARLEQREAEGGRAGDAERAGAAEEFLPIDGGLGAMVVHGAPYRESGCFSGTFLRRDRAPSQSEHGHRTETTKDAAVAEERAEPKVVLLVRLLSAIDEGRFTFEELKDQIADEKPPSTRTLAAVLERPRRRRLPVVLRPRDGHVPVRRRLQPAPAQPLASRAAGARHAQAPGLLAGRHVRDRHRGDHAEAAALQRPPRGGRRRALLARDPVRDRLDGRRGRARVRAAAERGARAAPRRLRLHRQEQRAHAAPRRPRTASSSPTAASISSATTTPAPTCACSRSTTSPTSP